MVVCLSWTHASGNDLTLGGAVLEKLKTLHILRVPLDSELTFETLLREVVSNAGRSLGVVRHAGKLFDCSRVIKCCFNAYVLSPWSMCPRVEVVWSPS